MAKVRSEVSNFIKPEEFVTLSVSRDKGLNSLIHKEIMMYNSLMLRIHKNLEESVHVLEGLLAPTERTSSSLECL